MPAMKIGQFYDAAVAADDGSTPLTVSVVADNPFVSFSSPDITNKLLIRVTAVAAGTATLTYSSPGYNPVTDSVTVAAMPSLTVTNGPVTGP